MLRPQQSNNDIRMKEGHLRWGRGLPVFNFIRKVNKMPMRMARMIAIMMVMVMTMTSIIRKSFGTMFLQNLTE